GHISVLCSEAAISRGKSGENEITGSPTESALIRMAITCGVDPMTLRSEYPLLDTTQRAAGRNWMVTTHKSPDGRIFTAVKGAPAEVAGMCSRQRENESTTPLSETGRAAILEENQKMAASGLRVLGFAYAESDSDGHLDAEIEGWIWLGLAGIA